MLAWSLWLAAFGCCAAGLLVTLAVTRPLTIGVLAEGAAYALAFPLGYATIGLVLSVRRPGNPIGWLYAASGLLWSLVVPLRPWVDWLVRAGRPLPLAAKLGAALGEYAWAPAIALGVTLPFLLVPDGRLRSRRWRVVVVASLAGSALALVGGSLSPAPLTETPMDNPFALAGVAGTIATVVGTVGSVLHTACLPVALVCLVLRFRASRGVERQQLRWVAAGAAGAVAGLLAGTALPQQTVISGVLYSTVLCVPVAVAVAVALVFGVGALGFFALPYTIIVYPLVFLVMPRLWSVAHKHQYVTPADFVRGRYGSPSLSLAVALTGILATMPYIALQLVGASRSCSRAWASVARGRAPWSATCHCSSRSRSWPPTPTRAACAHPR